VLATVKGDVHDIGKNLVDIILSNNGYEVVNIGIKQPINAIIEAAEEHHADAIGMSGLLVKSTVVMKENLQEMNPRRRGKISGAARRRGADPRVRRGRPALAVPGRGALRPRRVRGPVPDGQGDDGQARRRPVIDPAREAALAARRARREKQRAMVSDNLPPLDDTSVRSDVATDADVPAAPFFGTRVIKGIPLNDYASMLDERATFLGQWGLKAARGGSGPSYEELVETEGRPRLRYWLDRLAADHILEAAVVYGYFPAYSEGNTLVVLDENGAAERARFTFPRQRQERRLCLADFFKPRGAAGELDVVGLQLVTVGQPVSEYTAKMFARNEYRDYLEVHGLSVQLTEALAEYWHRRVRSELILPNGAAVGATDPTDLAGILKNDYRGCRYAFGYPACPDLEDRAKVVDLLDAGRIGVTLSEEFQLEPEQSTDAIITHHPDANYFNAK
jgi:5-methyltetrahydrofolate--homocysteine methyltransferase